MYITLFTEYSFNVLTHLVLRNNNLVTIREIASIYDISPDHLSKIVQNLSGQGFIKTTRGKGGGICLACAPEQIGLGDVLRITEKEFNDTKCSKIMGKTCHVISNRMLKQVTINAKKSFLYAFDQYTLADLVAPGSMILANKIDSEASGKSQ